MYPIHAGKEVGEESGRWYGIWGKSKTRRKRLDRGHLGNNCKKKRSWREARTPKMWPNIASKQGFIIQWAISWRDMVASHGQQAVTCAIPGQSSPFRVFLFLLSARNCADCLWLTHACLIGPSTWRIRLRGARGCDWSYFRRGEREEPSLKLRMISRSSKPGEDGLLVCWPGWFLRGN